MATVTINWTAADALRAVAVLESMTNLGQAAEDPAQARAVWRQPDAFRGLLEVLARAERVALMSAGIAPDVVIDGVGGATAAQIDALPPEVAVGYLAAQRSVESVYYTARRVNAEAATLEIPTVPAVAPLIVVAITAVGISAVAAGTWFAGESEGRKVELKKHEVSVMAQVDLYLRDLQTRIAAGAPLPQPPGNMILAAEAQKHSTVAWAAVGILLGGAAAAGGILGLRRANRPPPLASNPRRPALRSSTRRARALPAPAPKRRNPAAPKRRNQAAPKRRSNPSQRQILAIVDTAAQDGGAAAFGNTDEKRVVSRLEKAGHLRIVRKARDRPGGVVWWYVERRKRPNPPRAKKARPPRRGGGKTRRKNKSAPRRGKSTARSRVRRKAASAKPRKLANTSSPKRASAAKKRATRSRKAAPKRAKRSVKKRARRNPARKRVAATRARPTPGKRAAPRRKRTSTATRKRKATS
jgi:hypothetical protein